MQKLDIIFKTIEEDKKKQKIDEKDSNKEK